MSVVDVTTVHVGLSRLVQQTTDSFVPVVPAILNEQRFVCIPNPESFVICGIHVLVGIPPNVDPQPDLRGE